MKKKTTLYLVQAALIAAMYVALTYLSNMAGLWEVRFSEALCILPYFTGAAVPGLTVGCVLANILTGCPLWDVVFGSLATLIGAYIARLLHKKLVACALAQYHCQYHCRAADPAVCVYRRIQHLSRTGGADLCQRGGIGGAAGLCAAARAQAPYAAVSRRLKAQASLCYNSQNSALKGRWAHACFLLQKVQKGQPDAHL